MTAVNPRIASYPVDPLFLDRWSPRAFTGEEIPQEELLSIFEAARWAPSAFNAQPWRLVYARRGSPSWEKFLGILNPFNQGWAKQAAALVFITSNTLIRVPGASEDTPSYTHSFDTGAAWSALALQATRLGWHAHGIAGLDYQRAYSELGVPETYRVEAAVAIGRKGDKSLLPEGLQAREVPSPRKALEDIISEGGF